MFGIFLLPFSFRGVTAPYLWVFYKFLDISHERHTFFINKNYLTHHNSCVNSTRWEFDIPSQKLLGYGTPTDAAILDHDYCFFDEQDAFEYLKRANGNPLKALECFLTGRSQYFEEKLENIILRSGKYLEGMVTWCNCPSLSIVCEKLGIPLIHIELGPLRAPRYTPCCYFDFSGVNGDSEASVRYEKAGEDVINFFSCARSALLFFSHDYVDGTLSDVKFDIGVPLQVEDDTNLIAYGNGYDNVSLLAYAKNVKAASVSVRGHPGSRFICRDIDCVIDSSGSSDGFIRGVKSIISINSSVAFEAILHGKHVTILGDSPFSFVSKNTQCTDFLRRLNFFCIHYLVPYDLVFLSRYWRYRLKRPSERNIGALHLSRFLRSRLTSHGDFANPRSV